MKEMKGKFFMWIIGLALTLTSATGQETLNTAGTMMENEEALSIGGYGQIDYNQPVGSGAYQNGGLDVHRMVLMFGYKFNSRTQFVSEIEFEHVREVFVEQAFLQYQISPWLKFRGGLMLIPMGIINEYHEPSTFNGVERPNLDNIIVPTTWREIGAGFTGTFPVAALSYQVYLVNGFNGYDGAPRLSGASGFRKGRQRGAESFISTPNVAMRVNYFGIRGLQLGLSGYAGNTQSTLYDGVDKDDAALIATADSSVVGLAMLGADARYLHGGLQLRAQFNYGLVSNSSAYNEFTGSDMGSAIAGWYGEVAYNLLYSLEQFNSELIPFVRFEQYNTHASVEAGLAADPSFQRSDLTIGLGWKMAKGAMLKADYQIFNSKGSDDALRQFNAGIAVWF